MKPLPFGPFIKGVNAAASVLAQPKGSLPRVSNLILLSRGSLDQADGTQIINWYNGALQSNRGTFEGISLFQPTNVARYFLALAEAPDQQLSVPIGLAAVLASGGSLTSGTTYFYKVTALDGNGGETTASSEVSATPSGGNLSVSLTWTSVTNAVAYNVYRSTTTGTETILTGTGLPATSGVYVDNGTASGGTYSLLASPNGARRNTPFTGLIVYTFTSSSTVQAAFASSVTTSGVTPSDLNATFTSGISIVGFSVVITVHTILSLPNEAGGGGTISFGSSPPVANTTTQMALFKMPNMGAYPITYGNSNIVAKFPPAPTPTAGGEPAGTGAGGGITGGGLIGGGTPTPLGGVIGGTSTLPLMLQFGNVEVITLGNGFAPQTFTDPSTVAAVTSSFTPAFDAWTPQTQYALNSIVVPATATWAPNTPYPAGSAIVPDTSNGFYYVATKGGTSAGTQPAFPTTIGNTVTDGTVTWTCTGSSLFFYKCTQAGTSSKINVGIIFFTNNLVAGLPPFSQTVGGTTQDGSVIWTNAGLLTSAVPPPPGAAHAIVYAGSLWVANTWPVNHANGLDGPSAIRMSTINTPNSWNPVNQAFLDKDDGTQIQGLASFTITAQGIPPEGSLVAFKDFATYQIVGVFGAPNFAIQRIKSDMGCIAPRSIQFVPGFGIIRLAHLGVAVFDGVEDRVISEEIRPYLFPTNDSSVSDITVMDSNFSYGSYGAQTADPPMYVLAIPIGNSQGALTRILCYDLVLRAWSVVDLPFSISAMSQVRAQGTNPITMFGGSSDGVLQRWQAGDEQWYTGAGAPNQTQVTWSLQTPEVALPPSDQRLYCRNLVIRGIVNDTAAPLTVTPYKNGASLGSIVTPALPASGEFDVFVPIGATGLRFHATVQGTSHAEILGLDWHVEPKPIRVPVFVG